MSLDFRDQTPPKDGGLFKTGVWIFSSKKLTKFGPFGQFFTSAKKGKTLQISFFNGHRHKSWKVRIPGLILGLLSTQTVCSIVANQNHVESVIHKFIL